MNAHSVLVFPGGMPASLKWARRASSAGLRVVGASSVPDDPAQSSYSEWAFLPWIRDENFPSLLGRCLRDRGIDSVFTPHLVIWPILRDVLPKVAPGVRLDSEKPWDAEFGDYRDYRAIASRFLSEPLAVATQSPVRLGFSSTQLASLVRTFLLVPGECDYAKLESLIAIFRRMPPGDVVEIGSLWGRSAVVLAILARHYEIGNLLCVDPWQRRELHQNVAETEPLIDEFPIDEIFEAFRINLAPFAGSVNYLRARSVDAAALYAAEHCVTTEDLGQIRYGGEIALLHIDGNHALNAVRADVASWTRFVRPGGWIIFDDYCWAFGDGPRVTADEFCRDHSDSLSTAFVAGGALFVQLKP